MSICDLFKRTKRVDQEEIQIEEPERPTIDFLLPEDPKFHVIKYDVKTYGKYKTKSGLPKGLVVHFTAGWSNKGLSSAVNGFKRLADRNLGCMFMDEEGTIIFNNDLNPSKPKVAFHAGTSEWKGVKGISYYCMGMEICNAGKLDKDGKSWFGWQVPKDRVREVEAKDNIKAGLYHAYTQEQEEALINFCKRQIMNNPEFDVEWIVGHDEIAPTRKNDPGGSLSMTMPELRQLLRDFKEKYLKSIS